MIIIVVCHHI